MGGIGASAAPMNGYPKVFNIESDPHEDQNIGEMYNWVLGPLLKAVGEYMEGLKQIPKPSSGQYDPVLGRWAIAAPRSGAAGNSPARQMRVAVG